MAEVGSIIGDAIPAGQSIVWTVVWIFIVIFIIAGLGLLIWWGYKRKKWNLKIEIKLTRSGGHTTFGEWGKGFYDAKRGVVLIKRPSKGSKPIAIKIMDVRRYLQGPDLMTVIQVGPEDYRPVLNKSYSEHVVEYEDENKPIVDEQGNPVLDEEGKPTYGTTDIKESILNIKTDLGENKAWRVAYEEAAKNAYTIASFFRQYQTPVSIGLVVISCFVGFAVLWSKLSSVCA